MGVGQYHDRGFAINICAFSSKDSIIGMRDNSTYPHNKEGIHILKGLKYIGDYKEWNLFKLDPDSTDDMTAMLYTDHEKNFDLQFATSLTKEDIVSFLPGLAVRIVPDRSFGR